MNLPFDKFRRLFVIFNNQMCSAEYASLRSSLSIGSYSFYPACTYSPIFVILSFILLHLNFILKYKHKIRDSSPFSPTPTYVSSSVSPLSSSALVADKVVNTLFTCRGSVIVYRTPVCGNYMLLLQKCLYSGIIDIVAIMYHKADA